MLKDGALLRRRTWLWVAMSVALIVTLALVRVTVINPAINVRWDAGVSPAQQRALERQYDLRNGRPLEATPMGWRYELGTRSTENVRALVKDPAVEDTANLDRETFAAPSRDVRITIRAPWYPFSDLLDRPSQLLQLHQSLWLLLAGGVLLTASRASSERRRRNVVVTTVLVVGVLTVTLPLDPSFVRMGEAIEKGSSRRIFDSYFGGRVRYEKHLSQTILLQVYLRLDETEQAPEQALTVLSRVASIWLLLSALVIGFVERWSVVVTRYLALCLAAPVALTLFGWREFGYLSLNLAAFPLLVRGLRDGGTRIEAGSALTGLGAALHGSGLVALAGSLLAALGTPAPVTDRIDRVLRVAAWGTAAYVGWIAIYVIVLHLRVEPGDPLSAWRPWLVDEVREGRVSMAILSATGARDILMEAWVVGAPVLMVAMFLRRTYPHEMRTLFWYMLPSIGFVIMRWPFQGLRGGLDLVFAGFPALFALAWICAHDSRRTTIAAVLLASAHVAFWRIVLDPRFESVQIG